MSKAPLKLEFHCCRWRQSFFNTIYNFKIVESSEKITLACSKSHTSVLNTFQCISALKCVHTKKGGGKKSVLFALSVNTTLVI